jgi:hypothetical protein
MVKNKMEFWDNLNNYFFWHFCIKYGKKYKKEIINNNEK